MVEPSPFSLNAILVARSLIEAYAKVAPVSAPIQLIKGLIPFFEKRTGKRIELRRAQWLKPDSGGDDLGHYRATLFRSEKRAVIIYSANLNVCWTRLVICKELLHLELDRLGADFTDLPSDLIDSMIEMPRPGREDAPGVASERAARFGAIELGLPWCLYDKVMALEQTGKSHRDIAAVFRMPEWAVDLRLHPPYRKALNRLHADIDKISGGGPSGYVDTTDDD